MSILQQVRDIKANAATADFAAKLFSHLEGFDFAAAMADGNEEALAKFFAASANTADFEEQMAALATEREQLAAKLTASEKAAAEATSLVSEFCAALGLQAGGSPDSAAIKAAVADNAGKAAVKIVASAGVDPDSGAEDSAPVLSELDTWRAMAAGPERTAYYRAHKKAIIAALAEAHK